MTHSNTIYNPFSRARFTQDSLLKFGKQFWADERGATAIEYGLMTALIGLMVISSASTMGTQLSETFDQISSSLTGPAEFPMASMESG